MTENDIDYEELNIKAESLLNSSVKEDLHLTVIDTVNIFKIPRSTYYGWAARKEESRIKEEAKKQWEDQIQEAIIKITKERGYVVGYRDYYTYLRRDYTYNVSEETVRIILRNMNFDDLDLQKEKKSQKKKPKGKPGHPCAAVENRVNQNFYLGPRQIILTDITYLWYGLFKKVFYLCIFYDCYTKEPLGWSIREDMSSDIVREAYDMMIENHGDELKGQKVMIHSDQGSVYTATTYKQMLQDDGFIQSMSARGVSQDNAPCESYFGRMKERILSIVALAKNFEDASQIVNGYITQYNDTYQYNLAGLSPKEFYQYLKTGVYPCPNYFGVDSSRLYSLDDMIMHRVDGQRKRNAKEREAYAKRRESEHSMLKKSPENIIQSDISQLKISIAFTEKVIADNEKQKDKLVKITDKAESALVFVRNLSEEQMKELWVPSNWSKYPELSYVQELNDMTA